ncbi:MAG: polysaccharide deacetylase family protein [Bacteroidales bacterium]|nr:polysaccharide deacetylase family protein [Bacteroidales bacterium]
MELIKKSITDNLRWLVEEIGYLINPILLKIKGENSQLLAFYFHALYESQEQKKLNHIDPQKNMTVKQFENFVDYFLSKGYSFIKPTDVLKGIPAEGRYVMLTFDDGYYNNLLALGVLEKYRIPAAFFITGNNIKNNTSFWWDVIYKYRTSEGVSKISIQHEQENIKHFKYDQINSYIIKTFGKNAFVPWSDIDRPMTEDEVKTLAESPYSLIGNHTLNHAILPNYTKDEIRKEFIGSNEYLKKLTGIVPSVVAFPNGNFNDSTLEVAEEVGFRVAFNATAKVNKLPENTGKMIMLNRFMSNDNNIRCYGSFYRMGYTPGILKTMIRNKFT